MINQQLVIKIYYRMTRIIFLYFMTVENDCFEQHGFGIIWKLKFSKNKFKNFTQRKNNDFPLILTTV